MLRMGIETMSEPEFPQRLRDHNCGNLPKFNAFCRFTSDDSDLLQIIVFL